MDEVEVELRSFITKEKHDELIERFAAECGACEADEQVTYYFDSPADIRLQKNLSGSKIWIKKGKMHDSSREEIEVCFSGDDFERLEKMFFLLGYPVKVKWFRRRHAFTWRGLDVCVDENKGYGYILEIEKKTSRAGKEYALLEIKKAFSDLGVEITPKEQLDEAYDSYLAEWQELTRQA
jgi:predicted adenylyl cyclase CyaB